MRTEIRWERPYAWQHLVRSCRSAFPKARICSVAKPRQAGATVLARRIALEGAQHTRTPDAVNSYTTPSYPLGRKPWRLLSHLATTHRLGQANRSEREIRWIWGGTYQFWTLAGKEGDVVGETIESESIFDESGRIPESGYDFIMPMLDKKGAFQWRFGSPRGKNRFYADFRRGLDVDGNSPLVTGKEPVDRDYVSIHIPPLAVYTRDQIAYFRRNMSPLLFRQEILGEFVDGGAEVFGDFGPVCVLQTEAVEPDALYVLGVDLGKDQDFTSVRVFRCDVYPAREVAFWRGQKMGWQHQRHQIAGMSRRFNDALASVDATGLGDPVCDELEFTMGVPLNRIKFSERSKNMLIDNLIAKIQGRSIQLLSREADPIAFDEMADFEVEIVRPKGRMVHGDVRFRYGHPERGHDDTVIARALAVHALGTQVSVLPIT